MFIAGSALALGLLLALGALYRERDAQAERRRWHFELERSPLEKQALDARLKLLHAQIEPHFLFNTLANVQALVERLAARRPVLKSLIAYLRAAMPRLHDGSRRSAPSRAGARVPRADADAHARPAELRGRRSGRARRLALPADGAADAGRERGPPRHRPERARAAASRSGRAATGRRPRAPVGASTPASACRTTAQPGTG